MDMESPSSIDDDTIVSMNMESPSSIDNDMVDQPSKKGTSPLGLDPHQRLLGPSNYFDWKTAMITLFREHGVLGIMRDAIRPGADIYDRLALRPAIGPLPGATKIITAELDPFNLSEDMTLLLKANALIDSSLGEEAAHRVVGMDNVHTKWKVLDLWGSDFFGSFGAYNKLKSQMEDLWTEDVWKRETVYGEDFINKFMKLRAEMIKTDARLARLEDWEGILVKLAGQFDISLDILEGDPVRYWGDRTMRLTYLSAMFVDKLNAEQE